MLKVEELNIKDCLLFSKEVFEDHRGLYVETFNQDLYEQHLGDIRFVQDDFSRSKKNVLRGIHGDSKTWKLIHCPYGELYLAIVDLREDSPTYQKWCGVLLNDKDFKQVLIPPGCGNGHYILSDEALFAYKQSTYYDRESQFSIAYNDERFNIEWPLDGRKPILSQRDSEGI